MEDLQNFQDCTNENIEQLKEKLEELNLNNNKVSFDEYTEEKTIKQRKKNWMFRRWRNEEPIEKPKRPRTQKQIEAFEKARQKMKENAQKRKEDKQIDNEIRKKELEQKVLKKALSIKKKEIKKKLH